jgi:hypothetical protein
MSESQDERQRNQQLKLWAILWVIGSFVIAITVAVVLLVSGKGSDLATEPTASAPSMSVTSHRPRLRRPGCLMRLPSRPRFRASKRFRQGPPAVRSGNRG